MMKSVWTAVFSVGVSSCFVMAEEPLRSLPDREVGKAVGLFVEFKKSDDWEMAELIALGAKEKFGDDEPVIQQMLEEVKKAKAAAQKPVVKTKLPMKQPKSYSTYVKVYSVENLPQVAEQGFDKTWKEIINKLEKDISYEVMQKTNSSIAPFATNLSLVISAPQEVHDRIAESLKKMHHEKAAAPEKLEAK